MKSAGRGRVIVFWLGCLHCNDARCLEWRHRVTLHPNNVPPPRDCAFVRLPVVDGHPNSFDSVATVGKPLNSPLKFVMENEQRSSVRHATKIFGDSAAADHGDLILAKWNMELQGSIDVDASVT